MLYHLHSLPLQAPRQNELLLLLRPGIHPSPDANVEQRPKIKSKTCTIVAGWWIAAHQSSDESICHPTPAHMESIQVAGAAEEEEGPSRELRKMVPRRLSLLFLLFFVLDNTTLSATKSSRDSTNPQSKPKIRQRRRRPETTNTPTTLTTMRKKDHTTNTLTVGIRQSLLHDNGRSK